MYISIHHHLHIPRSSVKATKDNSPLQHMVDSRLLPMVAVGTWQQYKQCDVVTFCSSLKENEQFNRF
jgi:hypothetical protein